MKKLFWTIFVLAGSINSYGQRPIILTSAGAFSIENKEVVWTQIYTRPGFRADSIYNSVLTYLHKNRTFTEITEHDGEIIARMTHYWIDTKKNRGSGGSFGFNGFWNGDVTIQIKDGRYRVVVTSLIEDQGRSGMSIYGVTNSKEIILDFSAWVLNSERDGFKNDRLSRVVIMNNALMDLFDVKQMTIAKKDW